VSHWSARRGIDLLLRRWARAKAGDGQIVLVSGEPGLGKSAYHRGIAERLQPSLSPPAHFCSPYHQDSALFPSSTSSPGSGVRARRSTRFPLEKLGPCWSAPCRRTRCGIPRDLLSLPASERHPLPNLNPQRKKDRTLEALNPQLEGFARQEPVVIVFEDAHWIDPTSRELLDLTVERVRSCRCC